jgi:hypothetical protein
VRSVKNVIKIKFTTDWFYSDDHDVVYRVFKVLGCNWVILLQYRGIGAWVIKIFNCDNNDKIHLFNSFNQMIMCVNDNYERMEIINDWYFQDIEPLKTKLNEDLRYLILLYEKTK